MSRHTTLGALAIAASVAGCATVDIYTYQAHPLPRGVTPEAAMRQAVGDLEAISAGFGARSRTAVERVDLDAHPGSLDVYTSDPARGGASVGYRYLEVMRDIRAVTYDRRSWTVWVARGPSASDLGLHFRSHQAARLFLDAATVLGAAPQHAPRRSVSPSAAPIYPAPGYPGVLDPYALLTRIPG